MHGRGAVRAARGRCAVKRSIVVTWLLCLAFALISVAAQAATPAANIEAQITQMQSRLAELEAELAALQASQKATASDLRSVAGDVRKKAEGERVKLSGYVQGQFAVDQAASVDNEFRVRRARIKLDAAMTDMAALTLQLDMAREVELKDAYLDLGRATDNWRLRLGQSKVPFTYEVIESSGNRLAPERTALAGLFPGERDIGMFLHLKNALGDSVPGTTLDLAVINGNGASKAENNNAKDVVGRLRFVLGGNRPDRTTEANSFYIGYLTGQFTDGGVATDRRYLGGGVSYQAGPVWLRGEILGGESRGKDFRGWYGQAAYFLPTTPGKVFARYECFDEDRSVPDTDFRNLVVGYEHQLDSKTRVVLAHEMRDPDQNYSRFARTDGSLTTLRVQVKY